MRKLFFTLVFLSISTIAFAEMYYVVNMQNEVVCKANYIPSIKDLESRGEIMVIGEDMELSEAEYRGGKIVKHIKTQKELAEEKEQERKRKREERIKLKMKEMAVEEIIKEDPTFKEE